MCVKDIIYIIIAIDIIILELKGRKKKQQQFLTFVTQVSSSSHKYVCFYFVLRTLFPCLPQGASSLMIHWWCWHVLQADDKVWTPWADVRMPHSLWGWEGVEGLNWMMRSHLLSCIDPTPLCHTIGLFSSPLSLFFSLSLFFISLLFLTVAEPTLRCGGHFQACCVQRIDCKHWSIRYGGGHLWLEPHDAISACPRPKRGSSADRTAWPFLLS